MICLRHNNLKKLINKLKKTLLILVFDALVTTFYCKESSSSKYTFFNIVFLRS